MKWFLTLLPGYGMRRSLAAICLIGLLINQSQADDPIRSSCFGDGEQHAYDFDRWDGKDTIITKLARDKTEYIFVRASKDIFEVRSQAPVSEILFRFDMTFGMDRYDAKLVDVFREGDRTTALFHSSVGYNLIFATKKKQVFEKGKVLLISKNKRTPEWYWAGFIYGHDYYDFKELGGPPESKVASVRLVGLEKMEFRYKNRKGDVGDPDVFSLSGDKVLKDGVVVGSILRGGEQDEEKILEWFNRKSDEQVRDHILRLAETKEEYLKIILENNRDRKTFDAIKIRLDKAFAEIEIKEGDSPRQEK